MEDNADRDPGTVVKRGKKPTKVREFQIRLRSELDNVVYKSSDESTGNPCAVRENTCDEQDFTPVFLGHADLYVFADKWGVTDLKMLTLTKIRSTLNTFTLYEARRRDVVELLRFAYDNENTRDRGDEDDGGDELRALVILYTGCEYENLMKCSEFMDLVVEGGEFVQDLLKTLLKRLG